MKDGAEQTPSAEDVREQLARILASESFRNAQRSSALLRYLVEQTLAGRGESIKEYTLGVDALGRDASFDPRTDPIARVEASRLRSRLEAYYGSEGAIDPVLVTLPRGGYVPQFQKRTPQKPVPKSARRFAYAPLILLGVVFLFTIVRVLHKPAETPRLAYHLDFQIGAEGSVGSEVGVDMALSPDGTRLVVVLQDANGTFNLYARRLEETHATRLPGTTGARGPFISPDGNWVGFWAEGKLRKTLIDGQGSPITLCDANDLLGAWWVEDDYIVAALDVSGVLWRISADGGEPTVALDLRAEQVIARWPQVIGDSVIYTSISGGTSNVELFNLVSRKRSTLVRNATYGRYLPNHSLAYLSRGTIFVAPIDLSADKAPGTPVAVLKNVSWSAQFGYAQFAFARNGTLVYRRAASNLRTLAWLEQERDPIRLSIEAGEYVWPRLAPDTQRILYMAQDAEHHSLWLHDLRTARTSRLTTGDATYAWPVWFPDGASALFGSNDGKLFQARTGAQAAVQEIPGTAQPGAPWSISPDGRFLAFHGPTLQTGFDVWIASIRNEGSTLRIETPELFRGTKAYEVYPSFSPDGKWLAYASNESGVWQVYVSAFPDTGAVVQVSSTGGRIPVWSRDKQRLFYRTDDHRVMVVDYQVEKGSIRFSTPTLWSSVRLADTGVLANFDVSPDGERVLALIPADATSSTTHGNELSIVTNFF